MQLECFDYFQQCNMLENIEQNPKEVGLQKKRKSKQIKSLINPKFRVRAPSRQFNDPIYAGFDMNEQNTEQQQWGPWIMPNDTQLKHSHSLHTNLRKFSIPQNTILNSLTLKRSSLINFSPTSRSPSRSQLPQIKQKIHPLKKQLKIISAQLIQKKLGDQNTVSGSNKIEIKFKPKIPVSKQKNRHDQHDLQVYRPLEYNKSSNLNRVKLGTVVYNYCTNNNVDDCLLNYNSSIQHRKSEPLLERLTKQEMLLTRFQGLKNYWIKRKNALKNKSNVDNCNN